MIERNKKDITQKRRNFEIKVRRLKIWA